MRGFDCLLSIGGKEVAAQINADLKRGATASDVSDRIAMEWQESLPGLKNWAVTCNGAYVVNDEALIALEDAFVNHTIIDLSLKSDVMNYHGKAFIVAFPIGAQFNKDVTYTVQLQGTGALERI